MHIRGYPRLHFGLMDFAAVTPRSYGGLGISVGGPTTDLRVSPDEEDSLWGVPDPGQRSKVMEAISRYRSTWAGQTCRIDCLSAPESHRGLGSTTSIVLASLVAINAYNGYLASESDLVAASGRGRTSAIGCECFFSGGLVADAGQPGHPSGADYLPSAHPRDRPPSLVVGRWPLPRDWSVTLVEPVRGRAQTPDEELSLFRAAPRVDSENVLLQIALAYHGIIPDVISGNLPGLARHLSAYQCLGFKQMEIELQGEGVSNVLARAWDSGHACGMSSLGPLIFIIHPSDSPPAEFLHVNSALIAKANTVKCINHGYELE